MPRYVTQCSYRSTKNRRDTHRDHAALYTRRERTLGTIPASADNDSTLERCGRSGSKSCGTAEPQSAKNLRQPMLRRPVQGPRNTRCGSKAEGLYARMNQSTLDPRPRPTTNSPVGARNAQPLLVLKRQSRVGELKPIGVCKLCSVSKTYPIRTAAVQKRGGNVLVGRECRKIQDAS